MPYLFVNENLSSNRSVLATYDEDSERTYVVPVPHIRTWSLGSKVEMVADRHKVVAYYLRPFVLYTFVFGETNLSFGITETNDVISETVPFLEKHNPLALLQFFPDPCLRAGSRLAMRILLEGYDAQKAKKPLARLARTFVKSGEACTFFGDAFVEADQELA